MNLSSTFLVSVCLSMVALGVSLIQFEASRRLLTKSKIQDRDLCFRIGRDAREEGIPYEDAILRFIGIYKDPTKEQRGSFDSGFVSLKDAQYRVTMRASLAGEPSMAGH